MIDMHILTPRSPSTRRHMPFGLLAALLVGALASPPVFAQDDADEIAAEDGPRFRLGGLEGGRLPGPPMLPPPLMQARGVMPMPLQERDAEDGDEGDDDDEAEPSRRPTVRTGSAARSSSSSSAAIAP